MHLCKSKKIFNEQWLDLPASPRARVPAYRFPRMHAIAWSLRRKRYDAISAHLMWRFMHARTVRTLLASGRRPRIDVSAYWRGRPRENRGKEDRLGRRWTPMIGWLQVSGNGLGGPCPGSLYVWYLSMIGWDEDLVIFVWGNSCAWMLAVCVRHGFVFLAV
jgi:hypothetical protein